MSKLIITLLFLSVSLNSYAGGDKETLDNIKKSRILIKDFAGQLKARLKVAMKEGGPENAIQVCHIAAPEIASNLSNESEWKIGRTSLKIRNPKNLPDEWEKKVLLQFEQRKHSGEEINQLEHSEMTDEGFRYMKAIPTQGLCLTCHGEKIPDSVSSKLKQLYPNDKATGFKAGAIRGAFTLVKPDTSDY